MTLDQATEAVQMLVIALCCYGMFSLRHAAMGAFRRKLTPVQALETPLFFVFMDVAYNLTAFRIFEEPHMMLAGAILHCVVMLKAIIAIRVVRSWR